MMSIDGRSQDTAASAEPSGDGSNELMFGRAGDRWKGAGWGVVVRR